MNGVPQRTPWGRVVKSTVLADGIVILECAHHGGIWLSVQRLAALPPCFRRFQPFAGWGWYEKDIDAAVVIVSWPGLFGLAAARAAVRVLECHQDYFFANCRWSPATGRPFYRRLCLLGGAIKLHYSGVGNARILRCTVGRTGFWIGRHLSAKAFDFGFSRTGGDDERAIR